MQNVCKGRRDGSAHPKHLARHHGVRNNLLFEIVKFLDRVLYHFTLVVSRACKGKLIVQEDNDVCPTLYKVEKQVPQYHSILLQNIIIEALGGYSKDMHRNKKDMFGRRARPVLSHMQKSVFSSALNTEVFYDYL